MTGPLTIAGDLTILYELAGARPLELIVQEALEYLTQQGFRASKDFVAAVQTILSRAPQDPTEAAYRQLARVLDANLGPSAEANAWRELRQAQRAEADAFDAAARVAFDPEEARAALSEARALLAKIER